MPTRPARACPRCGALVTGAASCPRCTRARLEAYPTSPRRGYSKAWHRTAQTFRARFPFCGQRMDGAFYAEHSHCWRNGRRILAQCVDHIRPISAGGEVLEWSNLQSLCFRCNSLKD
jgi:5-methylcytosine-specific restriction endonuclease McrA